MRQTIIYVTWLAWWELWAFDLSHIYIYIWTWKPTTPPPCKPRSLHGGRCWAFILSYIYKRGNPLPATIQVKLLRDRKIYIIGGWDRVWRPDSTLTVGKAHTQGLSGDGPLEGNTHGPHRGQRIPPGPGVLGKAYGRHSLLAIMGPRMLGILGCPPIWPVVFACVFMCFMLLVIRHEIANGVPSPRTEFFKCRVRESGNTSNL